MIGANCAVDEEDRRSPQPSAAAAFESSSMETPAETDEENVASSSENASMKAGVSGSDEKGFKDSMFNPPTPVRFCICEGNFGRYACVTVAHRAVRPKGSRMPKLSVLFPFVLN